MEAKQYIKEFLKNDTTQTPQQVYDRFVVEEQGTCTYPYFRTLYNGERSRILRNMTSAPVDVPVAPQTASIPELQPEPVEIEVVKYSDEEVITLDNDVIPTGTVFDDIICESVSVVENEDETEEKEVDEYAHITAGFVRKCVDVVAGAPGSGKSSTRVYLAAQAVEHNKSIGREIKALFISGEMQEFEWKRELIKLPLLKNVDVYYISTDAGAPDYEEKLKKAIFEYDIVVADSFPIFISHIRMCKTERRSEKEVTIDLINLFRKAADEGNTNVQLINQANKDGNYKGGTELPHMTSSLSFVLVEDSKRYMVFRKNRNNGTTINRKLYFEKVDDKIILDADTYRLMYLQDNRIQDFESLARELEEESRPNLDEQQDLLTEI